MFDENDLNECIVTGNDSTSIMKVEYSVVFSRVVIIIKGFQGVRRNKKRTKI